MSALPENILPYRLHLQQYEDTIPWLPLLLDCYAVIDFSVAEAVRHAKKKPACHEGCISCCYHLIPLSTLECFGLKLYVHSMLNKEQQAILREKSEQRKKLHEKNELCLFNVNGSCLVYPLRPIACRRYLVSSKPCAAGEDATITRSGDMLKPAREYLYMAIVRTLPFYETLNISRLENEPVFAFYNRQNVLLSSLYEKILF